MRPRTMPRWLARPVRRRSLRRATGAVNCIYTTIRTVTTPMAIRLATRGTALRTGTIRRRRRPVVHIGV